MVLALIAFSDVCSQVRLEMTPQGFAPVEIRRPERSTEKLIELTQDWAVNYNRRENDVYDVSTNGLKIDAVRMNAFYYRNRGETHHYNIRYTLDVKFGEQTIIIHFSVKEMFVRQTVVEKTIADFFTPDGKLKSDFLDVKPSLEETVNNIVGSYTSFLSR